MVFFHKPEEVPALVEDLLRKVALTEHRVAGDHVPRQIRLVEHLERRLVLVGLVLDPAGDGHLGDRQPRLMRHQREQMHRLCEAVETAPNRLAVQGERHQGLGSRRDRPAEISLDPPRQSGLECLHVQGNQHLANPARFRRLSREAELVNPENLEILAPLPDRRETARARHHRATNQGENRRERMPPSVATARIGNLGKKGKQTLPVGRFHAAPPCSHFQRNPPRTRSDAFLIPPKSNCQEPCLNSPRA